MTKMANFVALALSFCDVRALRNTGTGTDFVGKNGRVPVQGAMGEVFSIFDSSPASRTVFNLLRRRRSRKRSEALRAGVLIKAGVSRLPLAWHQQKILRTSSCAGMPMAHRA
jgi:hypothetical protein